MERLFDSLDASTGDRPRHKALGLTRRQLGILAGMAGAAGVGLACTQAQIEDLLEQIRNRPMRRNIATMDPDDPVIASYAAAVEAMQALPNTDARSWTRQAEIHNDFCRHHNWLFLPWHRAYLYYFEQICREMSGDDDFALPYWNWTVDRQVPAVFWDESSPLFHENRTATPTSQASDAQVGQATVDNALATGNFILFAGEAVGLNHPPHFGPGMAPLESGPHNYIHNFVGGTMASFMSPLDPVFWLHHCRVDQLWVQWNLVEENPNTNDSDWTDTEFSEFSDRDGDAVTVRVAETTLYPLLGYRYDTQEVV